MSTIIGDKTKFGIEVMVEPELVPPSPVWGRMCIWAGNFRIGNFEEQHCGLSQCVEHLLDIVRILPSLDSVIFQEHNDDYIARYLCESWYESGYNEYGEKVGLAADMHKYRIDYGFPEMFDGPYMVFLLAVGSDSLKLLHIETSSNEVKSFMFKKELFTGAVNSLQEWLSAQLEELRSKDA